MKQTTIILMLLLALSGCLEEGIDGCPDNIRITFLHDNSSDGFDREIGNDVHLFLYQNDLLYSVNIIPYEQIEGGKEFVMKKSVSGDIDIVAWAVPSEKELVEEIPLPGETTTRSGQQLIMKTSSSGIYNEPLGHLYLGTIEYQETDITRESVYEISMFNCVCQFTASMIPSGETGEEDEWYFEVEGFKSRMDLDFQPLGENGIVQANLFPDSESGKLKTTMQGLLPSADDQYLSVKAYKGEDHVFTLHTEYQAVPGDVIHVEIVEKKVVLHINDWRIFDTKVEWI